MNFEFYDNAGYLYTAKFSFHATKNNGSYYVVLDDIKDSTGASLPDDVKGKMSFGTTMEVDTAIQYTPKNGAATMTGEVEFSGTGVTTGKVAFDTEIAQGAINATLLNEVYGIDSTTAGTFTKVKFDKDGGLTILEPDVQKSYYTPNTGVTVTTTVTQIDIPDGKGGVVSIANPTFDQAIAVPDTGTFTAENLLNLYGLSVTDEQVKEITLNNDGSITVTKKNVENAASLEFNPGTGKFISIGGNGQGFKDITLDFSTCSNVNNNGSSTVSAAKGTSGGLEAGRPRGEMISISVDQSGVITAAYDNGMSRCLGQIATAVFANPSGLEKAGDNLYKASNNSGEFNGTGVDVTASGGKMQSGVLEMSNVDLSQEFTEMITTQRGFQANSRIITVSDTMLEELTNLKR